MNESVRLRAGDSSLLPKIIEGLSPEVDLTAQSNGILMTVTTKSGTKSVLIPLGPPGPKGDPGDPGQPGEPGPKGDAYVITEEDIAAIQAAYDEVKADILEAAEQVAADKDAAASAAAAAAGSASDAEESAEDAAENQQQTADLVESARTYMLSAEQSASDAAAAASSAAGDAETVAGIKAEVTELVDGFDAVAENAIETVTNEKSDALSSITESKADALEAIAAGVEDADDAAEAAAGSATAAAGSASAAAGSAAAAAQTVAGIEAAGAAQVAAIEGKGEEVLESIPEDYSELSDDVGNLKRAFTVYEGGTTGQVLRKRSNADNDVEWASVGQPTDEQTENAVAVWLDAHPEATTTVEDFSLTANKLVKGTLGYVIPQQFGAKGDGVTDDSQAVNDCIDYAMEHNLAVYLPMGTYIVTHSGIPGKNITDGQSLIIIGSGQNSIIKRKADSLPPKTTGTVWAQIFSIDISPVSKPAKDVIFANFCIDSNRSNQANMTSGAYDYEASADIAIRNGSGLTGDEQYLDRFIVSNMRFYDPVADCVNISGSSQIKIKRVIIDKMVATDRHGTRNDIGITANPMVETLITNCMCGSIHFEYNYSVPTNELTYTNIENCSFGYMSLASRINLNMSNCNINKGLILEALQYANISDCNFTFFVGGNYVRNVHEDEWDSRVIFNNCRFIATKVNDSVTVLSTREGVNVDCVNCRFEYSGEYDYDADNDGINDHVNKYPIDKLSGSTCMLTMDGCYVDPKYLYYVSNQTSYVTVKNSEIGCLNGIDISVNSAINHGSTMAFENVKCLSSCEHVLHVGSIGKQLEIVGEIICSLSNFDIQFSTGTARTEFFENSVGAFRRIIEVDTPLTFELLKQHTYYNSYSSSWIFTLLKNDVFVYRGDNSKLLPKTWRVSTNNILSTRDGETPINDTGISLSENIKTEGYSVGTAKQRPTCFKTPGYSHFDTDLKRILFWNGTKWVNADGTNALNMISKEAYGVLIDTDVTSSPVSDMKVNFLPKQAGSGDPSSSNIRPISGWTGCTLFKTGRNVLTDTPIKTIENARIEKDTKQIIGDNYLSVDVYRVPKGTVYATKPSAATSFYLGFSNNPDLAKNDYVSQTWFFQYNTSHNTQNDEYDYVYISRGKSYSYTSQISLSVYAATEVLTISDITSESIAFSNNSTVYYGGYIDLITGDLVITHKNIASYNGEELPGAWISDRDVYDPDNPDTPPTTGAQVVYELATPETYTITPPTITLKQDGTTFWTDTNGKTMVDYWTL